MFLERVLSLSVLVSKKSFFLFGPRSTGKTSLIKKTFDSSTIMYLNLLHNDMYQKFLKHPERLRELVAHKEDLTLVIIDEIQRVPILLNEVHSLIEDCNITFLLTGSSARSLRKAGVNLLAGRAWEAHLFPLTWRELGVHQNMDRYFLYGGLPHVYLSDEPQEELHAYIHTYLKEEIQAESFLRKIASYSKFLEMAALTSGQVLNFNEISSDTGIPASTVREYYKILEDTFLGFLVPGWTKSIKRKALTKAKFYFFDLGVRNTLAGISNIDPNSDLFGQAFEHAIALELRAYLSYRRQRKDLHYWLTTHGVEVDFIIGSQLAIEVKSTQNVQDKHLKNLKILSEENICEAYFCVSFDKMTRKKDFIHIYYWEDFLEDLWNDKFLEIISR